MRQLPWPRAAGAPAGESAAGIADAMETALGALLAAWFPRCVDEELGGFLCNFDYRWRANGPHHKTLDFQARMARFAAQLAGAFPREPLYREVAEHGFRYLHDAMWDAQYGGWYRMLERDGTPGEGSTKHAHGSAYAISACVAYYEASGDPAAHKLALDAFGWLEEHGHDGEFGGYFGAFQRDGRRILRGEDSPLPNRERDQIGTPYGLKDANTTSDLLDALTELDGVAKDERVRERLRELFSIVRDRIVVRPGAVHIHLHPDWTPVPDFARYVQAVHTANHLIEAGEALGHGADEQSRAVYKSLVDTVLRYAWDCTHGGFHFGGSTYGHTYLAEQLVFLEQKVWWGQAEGMRVLLRMSERFGADEHDYFARFRDIWAYIQRCLIDARHGGWYPSGIDRSPDARTRPKASEWRDASHEGSSLLECIKTLRARTAVHRA